MTAPAVPRIAYNPHTGLFHRFVDGTWHPVDFLTHAEPIDEDAATGAGLIEYRPADAPQLHTEPDRYVRSVWEKQDRGLWHVHYGRDEEGHFRGICGIELSERLAEVERATGTPAPMFEGDDAAVCRLCRTGGVPRG